jgi:hypothetical protein
MKGNHIPVFYDSQDIWIENPDLNSPLAGSR